MLQNNVELDLKTKFIEDGVTQTEVAERIGVSLPYVNRIIRGREQIVNKTFLKILDELGYDVELTYRKKQMDKRIEKAKKELDDIVRFVWPDAQYIDPWDYMWEGAFCDIMFHYKPSKCCMECMSDFFRTIRRS